ncbi:NAD(P)-dependent methylenetetrahydromethanopterin dehydrogenase [Arenibaculum pallidiluteum]|uniref:NAD(P)-dependent methylenetetrahydromethanopterin dehydrogenase n=1 Tax=Arenibaculum pallidiluteum TaxID=2812559 RepID=UPI001F16D96D|nr:NAD(P)-dependent methylenetetrahydromethanopterin dehydrogenase [Arenibaculum pallidiluteum]
MSAGNAPYVLHMITPLGNMSPFDVNMAADAGMTVIVPYTHVKLDEVTALTQDAMFSREPRNAVRTGIFIGGRDALGAIDMLDAATKAMFPPFMISVFADPSGAFTTAAAMVAVVENALTKSGADGLKGRKVHVYGATGIVGGIVSVMAAQSGADVTMVSHRGIEAVQKPAADLGTRFGVPLGTADSSGGKDALMADVEVILSCGKAGVMTISATELAQARNLRVAADVNAVPPLGIEGVGVKDEGKPLPAGNGIGIGALAVGNVKFRVQHALLERMGKAEKAVHFGHQEALDAARELVR